MKRIIRFFYSKIEVKGGIYNPNFRCSHNAVFEAIAKDEEFIAICFCLNKDNLFFHFINYTPGVGFIDNTLGNISDKFTYHLYSIVSKKDFCNITIIFNLLRKKFPFIK
jgi:hypothetical protein